MEISKELFEKAINAESADEVVYHLLEAGYEVSTEDIGNLFDRYHNNEISKEELENVDANGKYCRKGSTYSRTPPHYLITTDFNYCKLYKGTEKVNIKYCNNCEGLKWTKAAYCTFRTADNDPVNPK